MSIAVLKDEVTPSAAVGAKAGAGTYDVALGYLRAFMTVLVVLHHSVLAYLGMKVPAQFAGGAMAWRAFPVTDPAHPWALSGVISGFNDVYFMALMFLLSGLFVQQSIQKKGIVAFVRDRTIRLGIPFLFSAMVVTPIAYYFAYRQIGGAPNLASYWSAFRQIGYWPSGPAWFISLLLAFDVAIALVYAVLPRWSDLAGRLNANAAAKPWRFFALFVVLSFLVYAPLAHAFGAGVWSYWGMFQFQTSRVLNYLLYFVVGIGIGAYGIRRGLLAPEGKLAQRWWLWMFILLPVIVIIGTALFLAILGARDAATLQTLTDIGSITFVLNCAIASFAWLAVFTRFVKRANPVWDSLSRNAYGIYIVHYAFVAGLQYALLPAGLPGAAKAMLVTAGALGLSWLVADALRRIPVVSRLVGV
ncbi:MAG TPA: acyltransferase [Rhizomicrobium sp.]|jgi:surface polysaccharide O-acyltransferase-like enzyme